MPHQQVRQTGGRTRRARVIIEWHTLIVGAGHVFHGGDAPPLTLLKPRAIKLVEDLALPQRERDPML
jgi:hypothetical protein